MAVIKVTEAEKRLLLRAQGCNCPDTSKRGERCSREWIRCDGRWKWMAANNEKFQKGLERLEKSPD